MIYFIDFEIVEIIKKFLINMDFSGVFIVFVIDDEYVVIVIYDYDNNLIIWEFDLISLFFMEKWCVEFLLWRK